MKIKDIFKGAATAAIAFGASKLLPEPIAKPVGTALSKALFSPSGGGGYGGNTTNIGMKLTFYTNAGSGRAADIDGYVGR